MAPGKKKDKAATTAKAAKFEALTHERDKLLKAEVAYKQRIEQLEESYREIKLEKERLVKEPISFVNVSHELLVTERDNLLEAEKAYKRTIEKLKAEQTEALSNYAIVYSENKRLRARIAGGEDEEHEPGPQESFSSVIKDRDRLLESEKASMRRIKQLEAEAGEMLKSYNNIFGENKLLRAKVDSLSEKVGQVSQAEALRLIDLEAEHEEVESRLKMFKKERKQFIERLEKLERENEHLRDRLAEEERVEQKQELKLKIEFLQNERAEMKHRIDELEKYPFPKRTKVVKEVVRSKEDEEKIRSLQANLITLQVANKDLNEKLVKQKEEHLEELKKYQKITVDRSTYVQDSEFPEIDRARKEHLKNLESELDDYKRRYEISQNEVSKLEKFVQKQDKKYSMLEKEKLDIIDKLEDKNKELAELTGYMYGKRAGSKEEVDSLKYRLHDALAEKQAILAQMKEDKIIAKDKLREANEQIEKGNKRVKEMEQQVKDFTKEMKILHEDTNKILKANAGHAKERKLLRDQVEQLQTLLDKANSSLDKSKKNETEIQDQLKETIEQLIGANKEIEMLKSNKTLGRLANEMQAVKMDRQEEAEQLRLETEQLRGEVKRLKGFERKMFSMEAEIRRLVEKTRGQDPLGGNKPRASVSEKERIELFELRRKVKQVEREKWDLTKEKRAWEGAKSRYIEYQVANRRLLEENKRLREEIGETDDKAKKFEMKLKATENQGDLYKDIRLVQFAKYVDKEKQRKRKRILPPIPDAARGAIPHIPRSKSPNFSTAKGRQPKVVVRPRTPKMSPRRDQKVSVRSSGDLGRNKDSSKKALRAKKPLLPSIDNKATAVGHSGTQETVATEGLNILELSKPPASSIVRSSSFSKRRKGQKERYNPTVTPLALL